MEKKFVIIPEGVCADRILVGLDAEGKLETVEFEGGCDGNGKALARLLRGMKPEKAVELLSGVQCEDKGTSCADQLAKGLCSRDDR